MNRSKRFEQSSLFPARGAAEPNIPLSQRAAKLAAPGLQFAELSLYSGELPGDQLADLAAWSAAAVAFAENFGEFADGEADAKRGANQLNAAQRSAGKNPVASCRTWGGGQKAAAFVEADGVSAYACEPGQLAGIHRPICGSVCTHSSSVRAGAGSKVKRISTRLRQSVKYPISLVVSMGRRNTKLEPILH